MHRDDEIAELRDAAGVEAKLAEIYGARLLGTGVVHVAAVWRRPAGGYVTLAIGDETPRSLHDAFALGVARARADAIVTTGAVLRAEPRLTHRLPGPAPIAGALAVWRRERLGKRTPPVSLVLSRGRDLDLEHPVFAAGTRPLVLTGRDGGWRLESRAADRGVEVVAVDEPSIRAAVDFLRRAFGAATITIEAGPSSASELYDEPLAVDELLLSVVEAAEIPAAARGPAFLDADRLARALPRFSPPYRVLADGREWRFLRLRS